MLLSHAPVYPTIAFRGLNAFRADVISSLDSFSLQADKGATRFMVLHRMTGRGLEGAYYIRSMKTHEAEKMDVHKGEDGGSVNRVPSSMISIATQ